MYFAMNALKKWRHRLLRLFLVFAIIYIACFQWQFIVSLGMGPDNIADMTFGLLPGVTAVVLSLAFYWKHLSVQNVLPPALIGLGWIVTGPYLSYVSLINTNTIYLNNIYDIYVGLYFFAIFFCLNMLIKQYVPRKLGSLIMTVVQLVGVFLILLQWAYYALYHSSITDRKSVV